MQDESSNSSKPKFNVSKKTLIIAGVSIFALAVISILTVVLLDKFDIIDISPAQIVTIETATELKTTGIEALKNNDEQMAQDLFEQAKAEFEELGDTNNVVDMEAQLYLLSH